MGKNGTIQILEAESVQVASWAKQQVIELFEQNREVKPGTIKLVMQKGRISDPPGGLQSLSGCP